jgi:2-phosphosulfolactate phosphatase
MRLDVKLLSQAAPTDTAIIIDVLRMTTTATVMFANGLSRLWVVADIAEALRLAEQQQALRCGERGGQRLPGFDAGNSPIEAQGLSLARRSAVLCTTNGSKAVEAAAGAKHVLLGAIVNAKAAAERALSLAGHELCLICAGTDGAVSLDDALAAAVMARELLALKPTLALSDSAKLVLAALTATPDLEQGLRQARHAALLTSLGFDEDITFAARPNRYSLVAERVELHPAAFEAHG